MDDVKRVPMAIAGGGVEKRWLFTRVKICQMDLSGRGCARWSAQGIGT